MLDCLNYFSCWYRAKHAPETLTRLKRCITDCHSPNIQAKNLVEVNIEDLQKAESDTIRTVQEKEFSQEIKTLHSLQKKDPKCKDAVKIKTLLKKTSCLYHLQPFIDFQGILRVGGQLKRSELPYHVKHPAITPRKGQVTSMII